MAARGSSMAKLARLGAAALQPFKTENGVWRGAAISAKTRAMLRKTFILQGRCGPRTPDASLCAQLLSCCREWPYEDERPPSTIYERKLKGHKADREKPMREAKVEARHIFLSVRASLTRCAGRPREAGGAACCASEVSCAKVRQRCVHGHRVSNHHRAAAPQARCRRRRRRLSADLEPSLHLFGRFVWPEAELRSTKPSWLRRALVLASRRAFASAGGSDASSSALLCTAQRSRSSPPPLLPPLPLAAASSALHGRRRSHRGRLQLHRRRRDAPTAPFSFGAGASTRPTAPANQPAQRRLRRPRALRRSRAARVAADCRRVQGHHAEGFQATSSSCRARHRDAALLRERAARG